jgi:hypothetical protein
VAPTAVHRIGTIEDDLPFPRAGSSCDKASCSGSRRDARRPAGIGGRRRRPGAETRRPGTGRPGQRPHVRGPRRRAGAQRRSAPTGRTRPARWPWTVVASGSPIRLIAGVARRHRSCVPASRGPARRFGRPAPRRAVRLASPRRTWQLCGTSRESATGRCHSVTVTASWSWGRTLPDTPCLPCRGPMRPAQAPGSAGDPPASPSCTTGNKAPSLPACRSVPHERGSAADHTGSLPRPRFARGLRLLASADGRARAGRQLMPCRCRRDRHHRRTVAPPATAATTCASRSAR